MPHNGSLVNNVRQCVQLVSLSRCIRNISNSLVDTFINLYHIEIPKDLYLLLVENDLFRKIRFFSFFTKLSILLAQYFKDGAMKKIILFTNRQLIKFTTKNVLIVFESHASFIFCNHSTKWQFQLPMGGKELKAQQGQLDLWKSVTSSVSILDKIYLILDMHVSQRKYLYFSNVKLSSI